MRAQLAIAAYTLHEARRSRMPWVLLAAAMAALAIALFGGTLALTETNETRVALAAPMLRLAAVFILASFVITSMRREADDRVRGVLLSLPIPRAGYLLAKLAAFCALGAVTALACGLALLAIAAPVQSLLWTVTLACELAIVGAFAMFTACGLNSVPSALSATLGFYLLGRIASTMQALAPDHPAGAAASALSALLPHFDAFARTEWLVYGTGVGTDATRALLQAAIYVALLGAASTLDLQRKEVE
jgi:ABC-type transport system involved in multi-copper enzyme maturation permease subunit